MGRPSVLQVLIQWSDAAAGLDIPPIKEAGIPRTLREDKGPLVIQRLGTKKDPKGSP